MSLQFRSHSSFCGDNCPKVLLRAAASSCIAIFTLSSFQQRAIANPINLDDSTPLSALSSPDCGAIDCTITSAMTGDHYFHSFRRFEVRQGVTVTFDAPAGIERIYARVTNSNKAFIDGTLQIGGSADLFLLAPEGIDIAATGRILSGGSFIASTARSLEFGAAGSFSAQNTDTPPMLTIGQLPIGLRFTVSSRDVEIAGNGSSPPLWQSSGAGTLALLGGRGGTTEFKDRPVNVYDGGLAIAALKPTNLSISAVGSGYAFDFSSLNANGNAGDVEIENVEIRAASSTAIGNLDVYGKYVEFTTVTAFTSPTSSSPVSGNITIRAQDFKLKDGSYLTTETQAATGGAITIEADNIDLEDSDDDNDIVVRAPSDRLSLSQTPESTVNTDPSFFARGNGQNDVGYQPPPVVTPPTVTPPTVTPPTVTPPVVTPPTVTPPVVTPPVVATPTPSVGEPVTAPPSPPIISEPRAPEGPASAPEANQTSAAASLSASLNLWDGLVLNNEDERQEKTFSILDKGDNPSAIASLCQANRTGALLTASSRGGIASSPRQLIGQTSLADLGIADAPSKASEPSRFKHWRLSQLVLNSPVLNRGAASSPTPEASTARAIQSRLLHHQPQPVEAIGWKRSRHRKLQLIAQASPLQQREFSVSCGTS